MKTKSKYQVSSMGLTTVHRKAVITPDGPCSCVRDLLSTLTLNFFSYCQKADMLR